MITNRSIVFVDIDHTISDAYVRDHMIEDASIDNNWDEYHKASINDKPCEDIMTILDHLHENPSIIVIGLTTRPEKWRTLTNSWLLENRFHFDYMIMRPDDDYSPSAELKIKQVKEWLGEDWQEKILCVFEDNEKVITAFKAEGITVLQVHNRRYS